VSPHSSESSAGRPARIVLVDGANSLYRAFFAIPPLRAADGRPTNAAYGFVNMLRKVLREEAPDRVAVVFDARGKTFRHELFPEYKATRDAQPEDLAAQIPVVRELLEALGIPLVEIAGYEADDVIATLVDAAPPEARVAVVSSDKDLMQLVSERVSLVDGMRDRRFGPKEVEERFGVPPAKVLDLRALVGDPSDNIPGVKGIGEKGAAKLIAEWGDLENLLAHAAEVKAKRARSALLEHAEAARLSKELAALHRDVADAPGWDALAPAEPDTARLRALYESLGFKRLLEELSEPAGAAAPRPPQSAAEIVRDAKALRAAVRELAKAPRIPLLWIASEAGPMGGVPVGVALGRPDGAAVFVPLGSGDLASAPGLPVEELLEALHPLLAAPGNVAWIGRDTKTAQVALAELSLEPAAPDGDVELAAQLLDPTGSAGVPALALRWLGLSVRTWAELAGRGARARPAGEIPGEELAAWAGEQVAAIAGLAPRLLAELEAEGLHRLYAEVELPLTKVLARMERAGIRVDEEKLAALSTEYQRQLDALEGEIHRLAGGPFLVSSPKQLQKVLFEDLKLPVVKKTKTGYSTDEGVLEQLAPHHELPARILSHRRLSKLKGTYVDALPRLVNPRTGRIHPTFHQLGAATGRLSAAHPNVQNIPIRTEEGVRIREAFVPAEGRRLLSADYSQVELRILAHYSGDGSLIEAFREGADVHRRTAAEVWGLAPEDVTPDQRARAKAINFGIVYGSSAFGIANQLGIATAEAQETIDAYFARYRGVRRFLGETIERAREEGFVRTFLGRRRRLPDLGSRNRALRSAAERMAVNTVIQGTAADLIKKAMVEIDADLESAGLAARMILQVHDELVFELLPGEVEPLSELLRERMPGVLPLRVPLEIEIGVGDTWREAHAP